MEKVSKGQEIELQVEKLAFGGKAVAKVDGLIVFLDRAVPGQTVKARITKKKKNYAEGRVLEVLGQSPDYVEPFCPHFGVCGGCHWQDIAYDVLRHRVILSYEAEAEQRTPEDVIKSILNSVPVP
jgi:23S rRNA (uracil1939-C5)-methyltransferase